MCLLINSCHYIKERNYSTGHTKLILQSPYIADKDLVVYKALIRRKTQFYTPVMETVVKLNQYLVSDTGTINNDNNYVYNGIHTFRAKNRIVLPQGCEYYPAIIPKGTRYYIGANDDVVSEQIIVFSRINFIRYLLKNRNNKPSFELLKT